MCAVDDFDRAMERVSLASEEWHRAVVRIDASAPDVDQDAVDILDSQYTREFRLAEALVWMAPPMEDP